MKRFALNSIIATVLMSGIASAATHEFDVTHCGSGNVHMLEASNDLIIYGLDIEGLTIANTDKQAFANGTFECMGWVKVIKGQPSGDGACKFMDKGGDYFIGSWVPQSLGKSQFLFLKGTGKYQGITGKADDMLITMSDSAGKDSYRQGGKYHRCSRAKGSFQLPTPQKAAETAAKKQNKKK